MLLCYCYYLLFIYSIMNKFTLWNEISKLERCIDDIKNVLEWKRQTLRQLQQWWFSDDVFEQKCLQDYINDFSWNCLWYLWCERDKKTDEYLEKNRLWSKKELAQFLCSKIGRYYCNDEDKNTETIEEYYKQFKELN